MIYTFFSTHSFLQLLTSYISNQNKLPLNHSFIQGMKTNVLIWVKVTAVSSEGSKLHCVAGKKKTKKREAYDVSIDGINVDIF